MTRGKPTHGLEEVKRRVAGGAFVITLQAPRDAYRLGLDAQDVRVCIAVPELKQDVYQTTRDDFELYVKVQMMRHGPVVVVSFKLR